MPSLTLPGAELWYETRGSGPLLVLIMGAGGSSDLFAKVAEPLSKDFTVILYDRRGHSKSYLTGEQDYSQRLERDADDVADLIKHVSSTHDPKTPVFVFGTSSGAIVALTFLRRHPTLADKVICHEPPLYNALPDLDERKRELSRVQEVYDIYRARGLHSALKDFTSTNFSRNDKDALMGRKAPRDDPYAWGNMLYWFERELLVYPTIEVPWAELQEPEVRARLVAGISVDGTEYPVAKVSQALVKELSLGDKTLVTFPHGHLGYFTDPEGFATAVRHALL